MTKTVRGWVRPEIGGYQPRSPLSDRKELDNADVAGRYLWFFIGLMVGLVAGSLVGMAWCEW